MGIIGLCCLLAIFTLICNSTVKTLVLSRAQCNFVFKKVSICKREVVEIELDKIISVSILSEGKQDGWNDYKRYYLNILYEDLKDIYGGNCDSKSSVINFMGTKNRENLESDLRKI